MSGNGSTRRRAWADRATGLALVTPLAFRASWTLATVRGASDLRTVRRWMIVGFTYGVATLALCWLASWSGSQALAIVAALAGVHSPLYWWPLARLVERLRDLR